MHLRTRALDCLPPRIPRLLRLSRVVHRCRCSALHLEGICPGTPPADRDPCLPSVPRPSTQHIHENPTTSNIGSCRQAPRFRPDWTCVRPDLTPTPNLPRPPYRIHCATSRATASARSTARPEHPLPLLRR